MYTNIKFQIRISSMISSLTIRMVFLASLVNAHALFYNKKIKDRLLVKAIEGRCQWDGNSNLRVRLIFLCLHSLMLSSSSTLSPACHAHKHNKNSKSDCLLVFVESEIQKEGDYKHDFHKPLLNQYYFCICKRKIHFPYICTYKSLWLNIKAYIP